MTSKFEPDGQARLAPHIAPCFETPDFIRSDHGPLSLLDAKSIDSEDLAAAGPSSNR